MEARQVTMPAGKRTKLKELGKRAVSKRALPKTLASIIGASLIAGQLAKRRREKEEARRYMEAISETLKL